LPTRIIGAEVRAFLSTCRRLKISWDVGVYDIDDVKFDLDGLRFKFLSRYEKVKS
jgi:hypothetical protein